VIDELINQEQNAEVEKRVQSRQVIFGLAVSALHSLITLFYFFSGNIRLESPTLLFAFSIIWFANLFMYFLFKKGFTARFSDPVLTVPMMLWVGFTIILTSYFLNGYRLSMLMLLFGILLLGAFRVKFRYFFPVAMSAIIGYGIVLVQMLSNFSERIDATVEVIEFSLFIMVTIGMLVTVTRITRLQKGLAKQSKSLGEALERVHELSIRDELTGLYNRRRIMEILRDEVNLAKSGDYNFVVCYLDLDNFKSVNDTYGHAVGDEVISRFAKVAMKSIRAVDFAGRIGGEEFIVVLTNTQMDECLQVAERIRQSMQDEHFAEMPDRGSVTVSIGVAQFREDEDLEDLLSRADENLYTSKETGRNKITKS
jgi:diguanylate cyclase (GGDEF)-like protein